MTAYVQPTSLSASQTPKSCQRRCRERATLAGGAFVELHAHFVLGSRLVALEMFVLVLLSEADGTFSMTSSFLRVIEDERFPGGIFILAYVSAVVP